MTLMTACDDVTASTPQPIWRSLKHVGTEGCSRLHVDRKFGEIAAFAGDQ